MISLRNADGSSIPVSVWKFPGGEVGVKIDFSATTYKPDRPLFYVNLRFEGSDDLVALAQVCDAVRDEAGRDARICLNVPYMPYARQDRRCHQGEAHALKVVAQWINSMNFEFVKVLDPHSTVTEALVDNLWAVPQSYALDGLKAQAKYSVVVAPDAGAAKKIYDHPLVTTAGAKVVCAEKVRDGATVTTRIPSGAGWLLEGAEVVVIDDICDGGATFVAIAGEISRAASPSRLDLCVTHGIFSKGVDELLKLYDNIYTANLMNPAVKGQVREI